MKSGKMRHFLKIQRRSALRDAGGGYNEDWQDIETTPGIWAEIVSLNPVLQDKYRQSVSENRYKIATRYHADIKTGDRLIEAATGRVFDVKTVIDPDQRLTAIEIYAVIRGA